MLFLQGRLWRKLQAAQVSEGRQVPVLHGQERRKGMVINVTVLQADICLIQSLQIFSQ